MLVSLPTASIQCTPRLELVGELDLNVYIPAVLHEVDCADSKCGLVKYLE